MDTHLPDTSKQTVSADLQPPEAATSLEKGLRLLRLVARAPEGARVAMLVRSSGLPKSSVLRLLGGLEREGLVERDPETRRVYCGVGLSTLGDLAARRHRLAGLADPVLAWLAAKTDQTAYLSVRSGLDAVCVGRCDGTAVVRTASIDVGTRRPLGVGAGSMALLAALPPEESAEITDLNEDRLEASRFPADVIRRMTERARQRGVAEHEGMLVSGISGLGVAVMDHTGRPAAGLSIAFLSDRTPARERTRYESVLADAAKRLARHL
jgi:DNA-binding IclR family transcriptional regulator